MHDVQGLRGADEELQHLEVGEVGLPGAWDPQALQQVIQVHEDVDGAVGSRPEVGICAAGGFANEEPGPNDEEVVVDVEEAPLLILLPQDDENRVKELDELVAVVEIDAERYRERPRIVVAFPLVAPRLQPVAPDSIQQHGDVHGVVPHLEDIVCHHRPSQLEGLPPSHHPRP